MKTSLFAIVACTLLGQVKDVTVSAPTRIDWAFAVRGFGKDAAQLPEKFSSTAQKYQLFVPKSDSKGDAKTPRPLVLFISPSNQPAGWAAWKDVCEKEGVFFVSPYGAGNDTPAGVRTRIVLDALDDVRKKHAIDPDQTYISGFSGGGRMACAIGYSLPEYFAGVVPVCGTNPITDPTYLRHRLEDRISVAFVTGETDFNRKENEVYMAPWFEELGIRSKLWVVPKLGHGIPGPAVMTEIYGWLKTDLARRRADAKKQPLLSITSDDAPDAAATAKRLATAGAEDLKDKSRTWRGVALLQGAIARSPGSADAKTAAATLKGLLTSEAIAGLIEEQGGKDEQKSVSAQAKALERFGDFARAAQAWSILARNYEGTPIGDAAAEQVKRLQKAKK